MLSKLKYTPFLALIAFVALWQPRTPQPAGSTPAPSRLRPAAWQPGTAPSVSFVLPAPDADTAGAFSIELAFNAQGGAAIAPGSLLLRASRSVTVGGNVIAAGENLADAAGFLASLHASGATASVSQTNAGTLFDPGEYVLYASVRNQDGRRSEWASCRFFVEGGSPSVVKAGLPLAQGDSAATVVLSGQNLAGVTEADFGAGVTVLSLSASATAVTCTVNVSHDAAAGPRLVSLGEGITTFSVSSPLASGIVNITWPTDRLPQGGAGEARRHAAIAGEGVILRNGAFVHAAQDLLVPGIGLDLDFTRTFRSDVDFNGPLGRNWYSWLFQRVIHDGNLHWYTGEGRLESFAPVAGGFAAPAGLYWKAERAANGEVTLTERHGTRLLFNTQGRLAFVADRNNNVVECEYDHLGRLFRIIDSRGERVRLAYNAEGRVLSLRDRAWSDTSPRIVRYAYNAKGELVRQQAPDTAQFAGSARLTRKYDYDGQSRMVRIFNPREYAHDGAPWLENVWAGGRVVAQRIGGDGAFSYFRYPANRLRRVIDPRGLRADYDLNAKGTALTITRHTGLWAVDTSDPPNQATVVQTAAKLRATDPDTFVDDFAYGLNGEVTRHTLPRGNRVRYAYPDPSELAAGAATAIAASTVTDTGANWTNNQFAGRWLRLGADVSEYRYYVIVSNSADTLTLGSFEDLEADGFAAAAPYAIFTANPDPLAAGNCLSVTHQDGPLGNAPDIVTYTSYEPRFQFPKTLTDARGYTTTFTWGYEVEGAGDPNECNVVFARLPDAVAGQPAPQEALWTWSYDSRGRIASQVNPAGVATELEYFSEGDAHGFLKRITQDPAGLAVTIEYERNGVGDVIGIWPPRAHEVGAVKDSHKLIFEVNEHGQITRATGPVLFETGNARTDVYCIFDENGNLTSRLTEYVTAAGAEPSPPGNVFDPTSYPRAAQPMAATWIEESYTWNTRGQLTASMRDIEAADPVVRASTLYGYDASFNLAELGSPQGRTRRLAFDERNLPLTLTLAPDTAAAGTWQFDYDANGNATRTLDARGFAWLCEFDGFDRLTRALDPLGNALRHTYDAEGNVTAREALDASSVVLARTDYDFDEQGRLWRTRRQAKDRNGAPIGDGSGDTTLLLDALGRVTRATDDRGNAGHFTWDNADRLLRFVDAALNEVEWGYDTAGGVISRTQRDYDAQNAAFVVSAAFADLDRQGNVLRVRDRRFSSTLNTESAFGYDGLSQLVSARQGGHAQASDYRYDLRGLLVGATHKPTSNPDDFVVAAQAFDLDGLPVSRAVLENPGASEPAWQTTTYARDARGRIATIAAPGMSWGFTYDPCDNLLTRTDPAGTVATFTHDARGLCTLAAIARGPGVLGSTEESWSFDALGRLIAATSKEGAQTLCAQSFAWNSLSLCELAQQSLTRRDGLALGSFTTTRGYDTTGFCTSLMFANGRSLAFEPDPINRIAAITEGANTLASWSYEGARVLRISLGNGTACTYTHDADLPQSAALLRGTETLFGAQARYDAAGRPIAQRFAHEGNQGEAWLFDDLPSPSSLTFRPKPIKDWYPMDDFSFRPKGIKNWYPMDDFSMRPKGIKNWYPMDDFSLRPKGIKNWYPMDDFSLRPKGIKNWYPMDDFSMRPKGIKDWYPMDDFSFRPKGIKNWYPMDDFSFRPKGIKNWYPMDDFSFRPKGIKDWYPMDDFSFRPKGIKNWYPMDDFSMRPKGIKDWYPMDDFSFRPKGIKNWYPMDDFSFRPKGIKDWYPMDDFSVPSGPRQLSHFAGVDLPTEASLSAAPAAFALARDYALTTRSSRVSVLDRSETANVVETAYVSGTFNEYTSVGGAAVSYANGRITFDAGTGLYYAYDWLGRLVAESISGDFSAPERLFTFDALGRRVLEEHFHNSGGLTRFSTRALIYDTRDEANSELALDGATVRGLTQFVCGPAPAAWRDHTPEVSLAGLGRVAMREMVVHELASYDTLAQQRFRCEDVLGRLMGVCDENGRRLAEYGYSDFGAPLIRPVMFDGGGRVLSVSTDTPEAGQTTITLNGNWLSPNALAGRELCVALATGSDRLRCATILSNDAASIIVADPQGRMAAATNGFVVFAFADAAIAGGAGSGGHWSEAPTYSSGLTLFSDATQSFGAVAGFMAALNAERGGVVPIHAASGGGLVVAGDATPLSGAGARYRIYAPAGVNAQTGALELDLVARGTRCFGGVALYDPPLAGFFDGVVVLGGQGGNARLGFVLHGARRFDPAWGRYREAAGGWLNRFER